MEKPKCNWITVVTQITLDGKFQAKRGLFFILKWTNRWLKYTDAHINSHSQYSIHVILWPFHNRWLLIQYITTLFISVTSLWWAVQTFYRLLMQVNTPKMIWKKEKKKNWSTSKQKKYISTNLANNSDITNNTNLKSLKQITFKITTCATQ